MKTSDSSLPKNAGPDPSGLRLEARIGDQVLGALGHPPSLLKMQVRKLWNGRYRANVFLGQDAASISLAHSFFLLTDDDGIILRAIPEIERCY